jgi:hypothetical protein
MMKLFDRVPSWANEQIGDHFDTNVYRNMQNDLNEIGPDTWLLLRRKCLVLNRQLGARYADILDAQLWEDVDSEQPRKYTRYRLPG